MQDCLSSHVILTLASESLLRVKKILFFFPFDAILAEVTVKYKECPHHVYNISLAYPKKHNT